MPLASGVLLHAVAGAGGDHADHALIRKALGGRKGALRILVRRLLPVIRARARDYLNRRGGSLGPHEVDDLMQDVWLALVADDGRLLRAYDASRGKTLEGYVGLIARREFWKRAQQQQAEKRGGGQADVALEDPAVVEGRATDPELRACTAELVEHLEVHLLSVLPERGQLVMRCLYTDGMEPKETSTALGVSVQVVYNWQHRIRKAVREFLAARDG